MGDQPPRRFVIPTAEEIAEKEAQSASTRRIFFQAGRSPQQNADTSSPLTQNLDRQHAESRPKELPGAAQPLSRPSLVRSNTHQIATNAPQVSVVQSSSTQQAVSAPSNIQQSASVTEEAAQDTIANQSLTPAQQALLVAARGNPRAIIVNNRQKGNPILKFVTCVPIEYGDIVADYHINQSTCIIYLSMKYHLFRKDYIYQRIRELGRTYKDQFHSALVDLQKLAALNNITLVCCWSAQEAGRYLETYKAYESKTADPLKEKIDNTYLARATDLLTGVKAVNKTDVVTLLSTFGSIADIMGASPSELTLCPGFGEQKARRLHDAFRMPFVPTNAASKEATPSDKGKEPVAIE